MSLKSLLQRFKSEMTPKSPEQRAAEHHHRIQLATAAILLETAYADESFSLTESDKLVDYLKDRFELTNDEAQELVEAAEEHRSESIDHFALTNYLRSHTQLGERIEIVKEMWRLVYRDGSLHHYENYIVRKLAGLLGLEHHVMIDAKLQVQQELQ